MNVAMVSGSMAAGGMDPAPAASPPVEQSLADYIADVQANGGGMPNLANPGTMSGELFGKLKGVFDQIRKVETMPKMSEGSGKDSVRLASLSADLPQGATRHGGPAQERLERVDSAGGGGSLESSSKMGFDQLRRTMDLALESVHLTTQTSLITHGVSQVSHSANTLLKGQ